MDFAAPRRPAKLVAAIICADTRTAQDAVCGPAAWTLPDSGDDDDTVLTIVQGVVAASTFLAPGALVRLWGRGRRQDVLGARPGDTLDVFWRRPVRGRPELAGAAVVRPWQPQAGTGSSDRRMVAAHRRAVDVFAARIAAAL